MAELVKFNELSSTAIASLVLKIITIVCMVLTVFIPILKVDYSGLGIDAILTFFSFNASLDMKQGSSSGIPTHISTGLLDVFFLLVVLCIVVTITLVFMQKNRLGGVANTFGIVVLLILFLNYYTVNTLNGQTMSGITLTITDELGYFLIVLALIVLFISSFTKFKTKKMA